MKNKFRFLAAFTLIEILVALAIFGIIAVLVSQGIFSSLQAGSRTKKNLSRLTEVQMAYIFLKNDLQQIIDRPVVNGNGKILNSLLVSKDSEIEFTRGGHQNPIFWRMASDLLRVHYYLAGENMVRQTWRALDRTARSPSDQRQLLTKVRSLNFKFVDAEGKIQNTWSMPDLKPLTGIAAFTAEPNKARNLPQGIIVVINLADYGEITWTFIG